VRAYLAPVSFGLGDLVVSLPAIQGLIAAGHETWLVARSALQEALAERIDGLSGVVLEEGFDSASADGACFDLRDHPLQADHFWGSPEFERAYGKMGINDIVAAICADLGVPAEFSRPVPLRARPRADADGAVLLIVGSDGPAKQWPSESWIGLTDRVRDAGLAVRVVSGGGGDAVEALCDAGVEPADTPTLGDAVDWFSSCRAVVGVDTGLTHIAVQQGTPTVAIHRPNPIFFRPWRHCRAVIGESCDPECLRRAQAVAHNHHIHRPAAIWRPWHCAVAGRCLVGITPKAVFGALEEVLGA
jgi:hypothetical protein